MFISVDLPEPDVPMIATNSPRLDDQVDAAQRVHLVVAHACRPCVRPRASITEHQRGVDSSVGIVRTAPAGGAGRPAAALERAWRLRRRAAGRDRRDHLHAFPGCGGPVTGRVLAVRDARCGRARRVTLPSASDVPELARGAAAARARPAPRWRAGVRPCPPAVAATPAAPPAPCRADPRAATGRAAVRPPRPSRSRRAAARSSPAWRGSAARVRDDQRILGRPGDELDRRGHARQQPAVRVLDRDDDRVVDHVLRTADCSRTWRTLPLNSAFGYACTVKRTSWPSWIRPMSLSSTVARICISERSFAMRNSLGADRLAATVWPTSTFRSTTMP